MMEWWNNLSFTGQIFAIIAIPATIVMILQSILLLFGLGFDHDTDFGAANHDISGHDLFYGHTNVDGSNDTNGSDGLSLITIRGLVAFFSIGGWTGLACVTGGINTFISVIIAFLSGAAALVSIAYLFKYSLKLQDSGNLDICNAVGKTGTVYIPIPKKRQGQGKISIMFQEQLSELEALTDDDCTLNTGESVIVKEIINEQTVLVCKANSIENKNNNSNEEREGISKWIR